MNDWRWDGDLFTAQPLNSVPSDCRGCQFFPPHPEIPAKNANPSTTNLSSSVFILGEGKRELEKRRRDVIAEEEESKGLCEEEEEEEETATERKSNGRESHAFFKKITQGYYDLFTSSVGCT